jgi:hypothetical protein
MENTEEKSVEYLNDLENMEENSEKIWKIQEKIVKIGKIWKKIVKRFGKSISFHYSTYFSSIFFISFHYSTCFSSIFFKSFHYFVPYFLYLFTIQKKI